MEDRAAAVGWDRRDLLSALALVLAVLVAHLPERRAGFVWDDRYYLVDNSDLNGISGLKDIWTTSTADISPLTFTTFWLEHAVWGLDPVFYHLANIFLHGACAVALWRVLRILRVPGAWLGAALWALHPVQVESVAWVSETKNTQSGLLFLLSIIFFLTSIGDSHKEKLNYALALICAAAAMASKTTTVILPVVLCLCLWWRDGEWRWRQLVKTLPLFVFSLAAGLLSLWTQKLQLVTLTDPEFVRPWPERVAAAGDAIWFYLGKLFWPWPLMTGYPKWKIDSDLSTSYLPSLAVVLVLFALWIKRDTFCRPLFFSFTYYVIALLPGVGLLDNTIFRYSMVFDHFQYLASMGPLAFIGAGLVFIAERISSLRPELRRILFATLLLLLGALSWQRAFAFRTEETLWSDTLTKNPGSWLAWDNLGMAYLRDGNSDGAIRCFLQGLSIRPRDAEERVSLGVALLQEGKSQDAVAEFRKSLMIQPDSERALTDLGGVYLGDGKFDMAETEFQHALRANPNYASAHFNRGLLLAKLGKTDDAIAEFRAALHLNLHSWEGYYNLGLALVQMGRWDEAIPEYRAALAIDPNSGTTEGSLGQALFRAGRGQEGLAHLQKAVELDPNSVEAHNNLGNGLLSSGQLDAATVEYKKALAINREFTDAHRNLGVVYLNQGKIDLALDQLHDALRLNPNDALLKDLIRKVESTRPAPEIKP